MEDFQIIELKDDLCHACSVLRFDDGAFGGFEEDGVLRFPNDDGNLHFDLEYNQCDSLPHLPVLKNSAETGCSFCGALRDATLTLGLEDDIKIGFTFRYYWRPKDLYGMFLGYGLHTLRAFLHAINKNEIQAPPNSVVGSLDFLISADERNLSVASDPTLLTPVGMCSNWLQLQPAPKSQSLCEENKRMLKGAISSCAHNCTPPQPTGSPPTRLLDLEARDSPDGIRLVETASVDCPKSIHYAALSYCWGLERVAKLQLKTTPETHSEHLNVVSFHNKMRLVQDAVRTTRAISIRYLWVDALCIIQGDENDWMNESRQMGSVYINAQVTICALKAYSCVESFLERTEPTRISFMSSLHSSVKGSYSLRFQSVYEHREPNNVLLSAFTMDRFSGPLAFRGWTFQEQVLSVRTAYFGASQIHFTCPSHCVSEATNSGVERPLHNNLITVLQQCKSMQNLESLWRIWYYLCSLYSCRRLAHLNDKFPALSGIATMII